MRPNQHFTKAGLKSLKSTRLFPLLLCSLNANAAPSGFISFQVPFWTQYKWHIISVIALCIVEALLILALLIQRSRQSRDVTELENSEKALRQSEERNRLVVDTAMDAVITADAQGRITGWNRRAELIFGWSVQEAVGQLLTDTIIPPQYRQAHTRGLELFHVTGCFGGRNNASAYNVRCPRRLIKTTGRCHKTCDALS